MRHATQARFDRVARGELERPAYSVDQMCRWTETDLNWHMREALRAQGYRTFHIREASDTGIADLIVYRQFAEVDGRVYRPEEPKPFGGTWGEGIANPLQVIDAWVELKIDNDKEAYLRDDRKAAQRGFMREHWQAARNAIYVMFDRKVGMLAAHQGDLRGRVKMLPASPYSVDWSAVFAHFKTRR
jgi:hypothetical protein